MSESASAWEPAGANTATCERLASRGAPRLFPGLYGDCEVTGRAVFVSSFQGCLARRTYVYDAAFRESSLRVIRSTDDGEAGDARVEERRGPIPFALLPASFLDRLRGIA